MPPLAIIGGIAAAGSIGGGAIAAHGATSAANTQADAANQAARLSAAEAQNALDFNKGQYSNSQQELAPYANAGYGAEANLQHLLGIPFSGTPGGGFTAGSATAQAPSDPYAKYNGQSFNQLVNSGDPNVSPNQQTTNAWQQAGTPFHNITTSDGRQVAVRDTTPGVGANIPTPQQSGFNIPSDPSSLVNPALGGFGSLLTPFQAPSLDNTTDPGYLNRLALGQKAIDNSAAARGGLLSSGTAKALDNYTQDYASNEYGNVYNRAFNTFETNQTNTYNRLAQLAGLGQQATNSAINAGQNTAGNVTNIDMTAGNQIGSNINAAGAARASGYLNNGNIIGNSISGLSNNLGLMYLLGQQGGGLGGGSSNPYATRTLPLPGGGTYNGAIDLSETG